MEFEDSYQHNNYALLYTPESIPTPNTEDQFNEEFLTGCECKTFCTNDSKCPCVQKSGAYYNDCTINIINNNPIYECNAQCRCFTACGNKLVQFGPTKQLKVVQIGDARGLGLTTEAVIKKGRFVCEYAGEVITKDDAIKRHDINEREGLMNYIFCVREYFGTNKVETYIDPSQFGNIGRYINHSCQPNCQLLPIRVNNIIPKLCIFALNDIEANHQLTFDYGSDGSELDVNRITCLCESAVCRQFLPFSKYTT